MNTNKLKSNTQIQEISAYFFIILSLFLILIFKIVPAILASLLGYVFTKKILEKIQFKLPDNKFQEKLVGIFVGLFSICFIFFIVYLLSKALSGENISDLLITVIETLNKGKEFLPEYLSNKIPTTVTETKEQLINTLKNHITSFADIGKGALYNLLLVLVGWLIGILIACQKPIKENTAFSKKWNELWKKLSYSFQFVVFAQVKVAAFNSICMFLFLFIVCPTFNWEIPYSKMLILITFLCSLLPIIGNLISNSITFLLALTVSLPAAIAALIMLMSIHKIEYLIISKSLSSDIDSDIWELLIVLFSFEILFGVGGMVFSPILYAFFKIEMRRFNWIAK